jgi:hypothetical protein
MWIYLGFQYLKFRGKLLLFGFIGQSLTVEPVFVIFEHGKQNGRREDPQNIYQNDIGTDPFFGVKNFRDEKSIVHVPVYQNTKQPSQKSKRNQNEEKQKVLSLQE